MAATLTVEQEQVSNFFCQAFASRHVARPGGCLCFSIVDREHDRDELDDDDAGDAFPTDRRANDNAKIVSVFTRTATR